MSIEKTKLDVTYKSNLPYRSQIKSILKSFIRPRKFKAYCVGTAKSGTHSVSDIFSQNYRSQHEPDGGNLIYLKNEMNNGRLDRKKIIQFLGQRDRRNNLHMESSDFAGYFYNEFCQLDPSSKFILPIRDCYSFLDSIINHQINHPVTAGNIWKLGRDINYDINGHSPSEEENVLNDYPGLYTIRGYLTYWANRNTGVLNDIPSDRLLTLKTSLIREKLNEISIFLNIPKESLNLQKSHSFKAPKKYNLLSSINPDYIENLVKETGCKDVMRDIYPNVHSIKDTFITLAN